jgi:ribosomal protein S14
MPTPTERLWIERRCVECGSPITVLRMTPSPICSAACYAKVHAPRPTVCHRCGKTYGRPASLVSEFCSVECAREIE